MSIGWLIPAIALLVTGFICMFSTAIEFAMGKIKLAEAAGALAFHMTVGLVGIWFLAIAAR